MPKCTVTTFFRRSRVYSAKYGHTHAVDKFMAADNHVPHFPEVGGGVRIMFGK